MFSLYCKLSGGSKTRLVHASPSQSPNDVLDPPPRNPSRSSLSSEMTFPLRADAYIATDLSQRDIDTVPSPNVPPPALPYPALAGVPPPINSRSTNTATGAPLSHSPSLSVGAKVTAGLLSSLGRNASTRKDMSKPIEKLTRSATRSTKQSLTSLPNPRPVQITNAPSVTGWTTRSARPRAALADAHTVIVASEFGKQPFVVVAYASPE
jgi:hypothetical protein